MRLISYPFLLCLYIIQKSFDMKIYDVKFSDGTTTEVYSLKVVKKIFKNDAGATAFGWKIYSNGDTVALGEVHRKGSNATKLNTQTTYNYQ